MLKIFQYSFICLFLFQINKTFGNGAVKGPPLPLQQLAYPSVPSVYGAHPHGLSPANLIKKLSSEYGPLMSSFYDHSDRLSSHGSPYAFGYRVDDPLSGNHHDRHESSNGAGGVIGTYGYIDPYGVYRRVEYIADENGFRVRINTNEHGVGIQNPADVNVIKGRAPPLQGSPPPLQGPPPPLPLYEKFNGVPYGYPNIEPYGRIPIPRHHFPINDKFQYLQPNSLAYNKCAYSGYNCPYHSTFGPFPGILDNGFGDPHSYHSQHKFESAAPPLGLTPPLPPVSGPLHLPLDVPPLRPLPLNGFGRKIEQLKL